MAEDVFEIVGTVVGGAFNVEAVVAEGGFAVVYRAYHGAFHAPVALKCLKVPTVGRGSQREFLERFREEGELLFRLSQSIPSVVRPLHVDAFETPRGVFVPYMALEWLDGEALDVIVARRTAEGRPPMGIKPMVRLLAPVARALARAHNFPGPAGPISIVHRDLKPDNIMVATINGEEVVKILDFGIAKVRSAANQTAGRLSQDGQGSAVPFTPGYAAPEQWLPKRYGQTGPWTDVWGLALTAVEVLAGRAVIDGDHRAMMGTAIDDVRRPTPRTEGVTVSDEVEGVFLKALAVDPRDRYRDVGEFWDAMEEAAGLAKSSVPQTGYTPQPLRDPRSDGPSPREERLGERVSQRLAAMHAPGAETSATRRAGSSAAMKAVRGPAAEPSAGRRAESASAMKAVRASEGVVEAVPKVPELELELDIRPVPAPTPRRPESSSAHKAVSEPEGAPQSQRQPPTPPPGPTALDVAIAEAAPGKRSGLDLAVPTEMVRRASQMNLRAVSPQSLDASGPPASAIRRSGEFRALPSSGSQPSGPSPAPVLPPVMPLPSRGGSRLALPGGLIALGLILVVAFYVNASGGGGRWAVVGIPLNWIAGVLVVAGTALMLFRVFLRDE